MTQYVVALGVHALAADAPPAPVISAMGSNVAAMAKT